MAELESTDVMDRLAGLVPGSPVAELRRQRPDVVRHTQGSDEAIFAPKDDGGLSRAERAAAALRIAVLLRETALQDHYRARLAELGAEPAADARWRRVLAHVERVTLDPDSATKRHVDDLLASGLTPHAVVSLSQLIAFVNFQARVLAGLRMLRGSP
jgi:uncharacterized protein YciW